MFTWGFPSRRGGHAAAVEGHIAFFLVGPAGELPVRVDQLIWRSRPRRTAGPAIPLRRNICLSEAQPREAEDDGTQHGNSRPISTMLATPFDAELLAAEGREEALLL